MAGLLIELVKGTRIPKFIRCQDKHTSTNSTTRKGKPIKVLKIKGRNIEALITPGGGVAIKMPSSSGFYVVFPGMKFLRILDLGGKVLGVNYYLCEKCFELSGQVIDQLIIEPGTLAGILTVVRCRNCSTTWEIRGKNRTLAQSA